MSIAGIQMNSFVDYPGKIAAVLFTQGCNMNCFFCHNRPLISRKEQEGGMPLKEILLTLKKRRRFLDGIVISGGEPTLWNGLEEFLKDLKALGYPVKLDTNGTNPKGLERLLSKGLVDYIAMDLKAPWKNYGEICGCPVSIDRITSSINLLMEGRVDYEFRTTFVPQLTREDVMEMASCIQNAPIYYLQQFRKPEGQEYLDPRLQVPPHSSSYIQETVRLIDQAIVPCKTRGIL